MSVQDFPGDRSSGAGHGSIYDPVYLSVIRLEAKIDAFMKMQALRDETVMNELNHIRDDHERKFSDHEARMRTQESRKMVEPRTVWAAFGLMTTFGSLVIAIINLATR